MNKVFFQLSKGMFTFRHPLAFLFYFLEENLEQYAVIKINWLRKATRLVTHCTSLIVFGDFMSINALIFLGLVSSPSLYH